LPSGKQLPKRKKNNLNVGPDLKTSEMCIMASTEDAP
jgi:hypothetical protein